MTIVFVPAWATRAMRRPGSAIVPHRQLALHAVHAALLQELLGAEADAVDELADVLAAGQPAPAVGRRPAGAARGTPRRPARPGVPCHFGSRISSSHMSMSSARPSASSTGAAVWRARSSGETSTSSSCSPAIARGQRGGLAVPELGERRVDDVEPVAHPLGLPVTDQHQLHRTSVRLQCRP